MCALQLAEAVNNQVQNNNGNHPFGMRGRAPATRRSMCLELTIRCRSFQGMTTYEFIMASKVSLASGASIGDGKGGARAALCRSTRVADEAITRDVRQCDAYRTPELIDLWQRRMQVSTTVSPEWQEMTPLLGYPYATSLSWIVHTSLFSSALFPNVWRSLTHSLTHSLKSLL